MGSHLLSEGLRVDETNGQRDQRVSVRTSASHENDREGSVTQRFHRVTIGKRHGGPVWEPTGEHELPLQRSIGWQSHGGHGRLHPAKACPLVLIGDVPPVNGRVERIVLVGVFALYAEPHHEALGAPGGGLEITDASGSAHRVTFRCGQQYDDAFVISPVDRTLPDGTTVKTIGEVMTMDGRARVDVVSIPVPPNVRPRKLVFRDLQTCASFVIFDIFVETVSSPVCPFRGHGKGLTFHEMSEVLRSRDRVGYDQVVAQARQGILACADLDEARGAALLFLCHVLDAGAPRSRHSFMIQVARDLEAVTSKQSVADVMEARGEDLLYNIFSRPTATTADLIRKALEAVAKGYSAQIKDAQVAQELGLSASHFRYLFRHQTGRPFHQYVLSFRLEKAKDLLAKGNVSVQQISQATGFSSQAHFCRAFSKAFGIVPTAYRDQRRSGRAS